MVRALLGLCVATLLVPHVPAQRGDLFDRVVDALEDSYYDRTFRERKLPALAERHAPAARGARTLAQECEVVRELLAEIPVSHLALYSAATHRTLMDALAGRRRPTLGMQLVELEGGFFAHAVLEGGPAERAGVRAGDRVLRIDGIATGESARIDWRSDDAHLPDPPVYQILCEQGERIALELEPEPGTRHRAEVEVESYSALDAARASVRVIRRGEHRFGYVHFWYMHFRGMPELLRRAVEEDFAGCDGLVLDIRGRGGSAEAVQELVQELRRSWDAPVVALIDAGTRSAKEMLAFTLQDEGLALLVGERTAGAVVPATFHDVGHGAVLMFPAFSLGQWTKRIEGIGVEPDVYVEAAGAYANGRDPILERGVLELEQRVARSV